MSRCFEENRFVRLEKQVHELSRSMERYLKMQSIITERLNNIGRELEDLKSLFMKHSNTSSENTMRLIHMEEGIEKDRSSRNKFYSVLSKVLSDLQTNNGNRRGPF